MVYDNNCGQESRTANIDFILPLYIEKPFTTALKKQKVICGRTVVKGFSMFKLFL